MIHDFLKLSGRNILQRKLRSGLTLLGIIISVMTIFVLVSVSIGLQEAVEEQFRLFGTDKIFVQPRGQLAGPGTGGATTLTEQDNDAINKIPGVKQTSKWTVTSGKIEFRNEIRYASVIGIDLETDDLFIETGAYEAEQGRLIKEGDKKDVMIGSHYKDSSFFTKDIRTGNKILINDQEFEIKGILKPIGNPGDDRLIYMSIEDFRDLFNINDRIDTIVVQIEKRENVEEIAEKIERKLFKTRNVDKDTKDFTILTPEALLESFGVILNIITGFLLGVATISLLVGGIGIANTMFTSVLERRKEIGVMKAVGAQNKNIVLIFLIESALLGLIGGIVGVFVGLGVAEAIEYVAVTQLKTTLLQTATPAYLFFGCLIFAVLAGSVSGFLPALNATKIKPVDALRYE